MFFTTYLEKVFLRVTYKNISNEFRQPSNSVGQTTITAERKHVYKNRFTAT